MKRAKAITKPIRRSFDGKAFKYDLELACDAIALVVGKRIKEALTDRVTDAEVRALSRQAAKIGLLGLLGDQKVMRHVADARTSQSGRNRKDGKIIELVESQQRAAQLKNEGMTAKKIQRQLIEEDLAKILSDGSVRLEGVKRKIPNSSWDCKLTRWRDKVNGSA